MHKKTLKLKINIAMFPLKLLKPCTNHSNDSAKPFQVDQNSTKQGEDIISSAFFHLQERMEEQILDLCRRKDADGDIFAFLLRAPF